MCICLPTGNHRVPLFSPINHFKHLIHFKVQYSCPHEYLFNRHVHFILQHRKRLYSTLFIDQGYLLQTHAPEAKCANVHFLQGCNPAPMGGLLCLFYVAYADFPSVLGAHRAGRRDQRKKAIGDPFVSTDEELPPWAHSVFFRSSLHFYSSVRLLSSPPLPLLGL